MRKYVLSLLFILVAVTAFGQKKSKVNLVRSDRSEYVKRNGVDMIKVFNGVWQQDYSTMRSDSAYFHPAANSFEAFGHVNINQGDTLNIFSDKLDYNGNTKIAILTDNVKMVDKDATLTTNYFTYNTATRIGTYTNGGKIVNKTNTLTSQNGYYFANSHDAYFRYNVVCLTNDATIKTDTMRYNSQTRINYFYGPTNIYGKKDTDVLYTENGLYNTVTEQAFFGKKNLYTQKTKSLKGDSLFYDRIKGYGRAVKHVVFTDNEQKITIFGGLGTYYKKNELSVITQDPYVVLVTEDSTKNDSSKKAPPLPLKKDTVAKQGKTSPIKAPPLTPAGKKATVAPTKAPAKTAMTPPPNTMPTKLTMPIIDSFRQKAPPQKLDTAKLLKTATTQANKVDKNTQSKIKGAIKQAPKAKLDTNEILSKNPVLPVKTDTGKLKHDSVYMSADTIATRILTYKELKTIQEQERLSHIRDTSSKPKVEHIVYKTSPKFLSISAPKIQPDTTYRKPDYFGPPKPKVEKDKKKDIAAGPKKKAKVDSTFIDRPITLKDTARVRILMAFHQAKIFKSDLQAIADSIFYSNSDSTIRCYTKPMIWTQGSQLSGDTVNLQMRHKKMDNMTMFPNAFIVNIENADSANFNQLGGKRMKGYFKNSKLSKIIIDGNAESIYFVRDSTTKEITDMQHSFSSRMRVLMKNNEITDVAFLTKPDHSFKPIGKVTTDEKVLKGFIWKPKDRPISKESIIPSYRKRTETAKPHVAGTPRPKKMYEGKGAPPARMPPGKGKGMPDSLAKPDSTTNYKPRSNTTPADSVIKTPATKAMPNPKKDTSAVKPPALSPAVQPKKDTVSGKK